LRDIRGFTETDPSEWEWYLDAQESERELSAIRGSTMQGRPYGGKEFVYSIEKIAGICLGVLARGRPKKYDK
jgi:hypothetical protein